ncbi:MAG: HD domain-containing protein [bacterium]|nr:HD domain-containing protein [bacterium]
MRLCSTKDLCPGMQVARDICDERLELLIAAGIELDLRMIQRLADLEIADVYIHEPGTDDIIPRDDVVSDKTRRKTHKLLQRTFGDLTSLADMSEFANEDVVTILQYDDRFANAVSVSHFHEVVHSTVDDLFVRHEDIFETPVVKRYLDRKYEHALNTSVLAIMLGRAFHYPPEKLVVLGTSSMLHDVGKLIFPKLTSKHYRDLTSEERRRLRLHPAAGAAILSRGGGNTALEQATIRQHHEQQDGRGYPLGLMGDNLPPVESRAPRHREIIRYAEILAVANAFDNLINGDLVVEPMSPVKAMETLVRGAGTLYNRAVVSEALRIINVYPVGSIVEIRIGDQLFETGARGVVRRGNHQYLNRPEILVLWDRRGQRCAPRVLDLNQHPGVEIELV